jgi:hypothetical protein
MREGKQTAFPLAIGLAKSAYYVSFSDSQRPSVTACQTVLVADLSRQVTTCIVSYGCARTRSGTLGRFAEVLRRTGAGWVNTYSEEEFVATFQRGGFRLGEKRDWHTPEGSERIFVFHTAAGAAVKLDR